MTHYDITHTQFSDIFGRRLKVTPIDNEFRLYGIGEELELTINDEIVRCKVERMAIVENTQHVNVTIIEEDVHETPGPHF